MLLIFRFGANINTEHQPILEFIEEFHCVIFIAGQRVAAAAGREIAVQIGSS